MKRELKLEVDRENMRRLVRRGWDEGGIEWRPSDLLPEDHVAVEDAPDDDFRLILGRQGGITYRMLFPNIVDDMKRKVGRSRFSYNSCFDGERHALQAFMPLVKDGLIPEEKKPLRICDGELYVSSRGSESCEEVLTRVEPVKHVVNEFQKMIKGHEQQIEFIKNDPQKAIQKEEREIAKTQEKIDIINSCVNGTY